jgi:hypothetical protein
LRRRFDSLRPLEFIGRGCIEIAFDFGVKGRLGRDASCEPLVANIVAASNAGLQNPIGASHTDRAGLIVRVLRLGHLTERTELDRCIQLSFGRYP